MNVPANQSPGLPDIIQRAASDPSFDLDKLQRLLDMQEAAEVRNAEKAFSAAHTAAEAEMRTIAADANNPQTRSRYATFAQVDRDARPIYTKHGFAISFTTEQMGVPDSIMVVGTLSHQLGCSRRYQVPVPIVTKGIQGREMMTPIHATMSAISYGKRNLQIMMFNLAIGDDDDGNAAGRRMPTTGMNPWPVPAPHDALTGEIMKPHTLEFQDDPTTNEPERWPDWGGRFIAAVRTADTEAEVEAWQNLNLEKLEDMKQSAPKVFIRLEAAVNAHRIKLAAGEA